MGDLAGQNFGAVPNAPALDNNDYLNYETSSGALRTIPMVTESALRLILSLYSAFPH